MLTSSSHPRHTEGGTRGGPGAAQGPGGGLRLDRRRPSAAGVVGCRSSSAAASKSNKRRMLGSTKLVKRKVHACAICRKLKVRSRSCWGRWASNQGHGSRPSSTGFFCSCIPPQAKCDGQYPCSQCFKASLPCTPQLRVDEEPIPIDQRTLNRADPRAMVSGSCDGFGQAGRRLG